MNFLLVGNSRLHWAENVESEYKFFHTKINDPIPKNINIKKIIWASVGKNPKFIVLDKIESTDINDRSDFKIAQMLYKKTFV